MLSARRWDIALVTATIPSTRLRRLNLVAELTALLEDTPILSDKDARLNARVDVVLRLMVPTIRMLCESRDEPSRAEGLVRNQNVVSVERLRAALHGTDAEFRDVCLAITKDAWWVLRDTDALESYVPREEIKRTVELAVWHQPTDMLPYIHVVAQYLGRNEALKVVKLNEKRLRAGKAGIRELATLRRSGLTTQDQLATFLEATVSSDQFWQGLGKPASGWHDRHQEEVRRRVWAFASEDIRTVEGFIAEGLLSTDTVHENLELRTGSVSGTVASFLLRKQSSVLFPREDSDTYLSQVLAERQIFFGSEVLPREITVGMACDILRQLHDAGAIDEPSRQHFLSLISTSTDREKLAVAMEAATDRRAPQNEFELYRAGLEAATRLSGSQDWAKLADQVEAHEPFDRGVLGIGSLDLFLSDHTLTAKQKGELTFLWIRTNPAAFFSFEMERATAALSEAGALTEVALAMRAHTSSQLARQWQDWSSALGLTRAQAQATVLRSLIAEDRPAREANFILQMGDSRIKPLLTPKQLTPALVAALSRKQSDLDKTQRDLYFLFNQTGEDEARRILEVMQRRLPDTFLSLVDNRFAHLIDLDALVTHMLKTGDHYHILDALKNMPNLERHLAPGTLDAWASWCAEQMEPREIETRGANIWLHCNFQQRDALTRSLFSNPAVAELLLESHTLFAAACRRHVSGQISARASSLEVAEVIPKSTAKTNLRLRKPQAYPPVVLGTASYAAELAANAGEAERDQVEQLREMGLGLGERTEVANLELATLLPKGFVRAVRKIDMTPGLSRADVIAAKAFIWTGQRLGLGPRQITNAYLRMKYEHVDPVKVAMWIHQSRHSHLVLDFLRDFFKAYARGIPVAEWKRGKSREIAGIPPRLSERWFQNHRYNHTYNGQPYIADVIHELIAIPTLGASPAVNCLHYGLGRNRHGLIGMLSPEVKAFEVRGPSGKVVANAVLRLGLGSKTGVLLEPVYVTTNDPSLRKMVHYWALIATEYLVTASPERIASGILKPDYQKNFMADNHGRVEFLDEGAARFRLPRPVSPFTYDEISGTTSQARFVRATLMQGRWPPQLPVKTL
jgi:hypothetical protein